MYLPQESTIDGVEHFEVSVGYLGVGIWENHLWSEMLSWSTVQLQQNLCERSPTWDDHLSKVVTLKVPKYLYVYLPYWYICAFPPCCRQAPA